MQNLASYSMDEEKALVEGCARREAHQWELFATRYDRLIKSTAAAVANKACGPAGDVQDLVGYVYEMLLDDKCRRLTAWRAECRLSTYLVQITRNLCIDRLRRSRREMPAAELSQGRLPEDIEAPQIPAGERIEQEEWKRVERQALQDALKRLPQRQSVIMRLRLRGKSLREIAALMGVPEGTVFVENSRAMDRLRVALMACRRAVNGSHPPRPRGKDSP